MDAVLERRSWSTFIVLEAMDIFEMLKTPHYFSTARAAQEAAVAFATALPPQAWVLLEGAVGTGKTHWVKGMAKALGIEQPISSPSFAICNRYLGDRLLLHLDAYRLETKSPLASFISEDWLEGPFLGAIEWPSCLDLRLLELYPDSIYSLFLWIDEAGRHSIQLKTS